MTITLEIYGVLWCGARAMHSYNIPAPITTDEEAKRHASDFASVLDWHLVRSTCTYERTGTLSCRIDERRTLRGFRHGMTPQRFYKLTEG
jgi:hypothetical protein